MRLGFAVKVIGRPGLPSNDARRWQSGPHLRVSLEYLGAIFTYLAEHDITMYRISSDLAPYVNVDLDVMEGDAKRMRGTRPFGFTDLTRGKGLDRVVDYIVEHGGLRMDARKSA